MSGSQNFTRSLGTSVEGRDILASARFDLADAPVADGATLLIGGIHGDEPGTVLLLDSFSGQEGISQPFRFFLNMVSEVTIGNPGKVKPHDLVGTSMTIRVALSTSGTGADSDHHGDCPHRTVPPFAIRQRFPCDMDKRRSIASPAGWLRSS